MSRAITKKIDGERLRLELNRRDLRMPVGSVGLGHSSEYIAGVIKSGRMTEATGKMLEKLYNIPVKDLEVPEEGAKEKSLPGQLSFGSGQINYDKLFEVVKEAVKEAVKEGVVEEWQKIRDIQALKVLEEGK